MAYVERGVVKSKRSLWRLKTITDFFWAIINFIGVFFSTMFSMDKSNTYRKGSGSSKKWDGGPGGPGSGPYGGGPRGPPRGLDNVRGLTTVHYLPVVPAAVDRWRQIWYFSNYVFGLNVIYRSLLIDQILANMHKKKRN